MDAHSIEFEKRILLELFDSEGSIRISARELGLILANRVTHIAQTRYSTFSNYPVLFKCQIRNNIDKDLVQVFREGEELKKDKLGNIKLSVSIKERLIIPAQGAVHLTFDKKEVSVGYWNQLVPFLIEGYNVHKSKFV